MSWPFSQAAACIYMYPAARSASLNSAAALRCADAGRLEACQLPESIFLPGNFLFLFHGNSGATDERRCLAILMISCQHQIVSDCKCICPAELKTALALLRANYKRMDAVPTVSHVDPGPPGAKLTSSWFPLGASGWWGLSGGVLLVAARCWIICLQLG